MPTSSIDSNLVERVDRARTAQVHERHVGGRQLEELLERLARAVVVLARPLVRRLRDARRTARRDAWTRRDAWMTRGT